MDDKDFPLLETPETEDALAALPNEEGDRPDPDVMLGLLTSADVTERMLAARAFCEIQDERATPYLIQLLQESCPLVRVSAAYALGRNLSTAAVDALIQQLDRDWNGYVRKGIVWALGNCGVRFPFPEIYRRTLDPLIRALQTDISAVRLWAASSLAQVAEASEEAAATAIPALALALAHDTIAAVRSNCAWALGHACRKIPLGQLYTDAIDHLIAALQDSDMGVQEDAKAALFKLGDARGLQAIEALELHTFG